MDKSGHRKRALDVDEGKDSARESKESERKTSYHLDVDIAGIGPDCGRAIGAVKSRRISLDSSESTFKLSLKSAAPPALHLMANSDCHMPRVSEPLETIGIGGHCRPYLNFKTTQNEDNKLDSAPLGTSRLVAEDINRSPAHIRRSDRAVSFQKARPGVSRVDSLDSNNPVVNVMSPQLREVGGQISNSSFEYGATNTPYQIPIVAVATTPLIKPANDYLSFFTQQKFEQANAQPVQMIRTPLFNLDGIQSSKFQVPLPTSEDNDVSSDEELTGIPGPDIPDPEISFSQEKLGELSVTENRLDETVGLILCESLARKLTKGERERMKLLNLYSIALTLQSSPIMLGRDQFQDVFGGNFRGGMLYHLSRRHCLIHVEKVALRDNSGSTGLRVRIEDTSTNGIKINGIQLKNGQSHELELYDIITLLRIRRDEDDISLEYQLVRPDPSPKILRDKRKKSRYDGRFVIPSGKFSCEPEDTRSCQALSLAQNIGIVSPTSLPVRAALHDVCHRIQMGPKAHFLMDTKAEMRNSGQAQQPLILNRKIKCTILFSDKFMQNSSQSSQPFEVILADNSNDVKKFKSNYQATTTQEANFDYREELSEILSIFASVRTFDASTYHSATKQTIKDAISDDSDVILYTGEGDVNHLLVEAPNDLFVRYEKADILQLFSEANCNRHKLIIVIAPNPEPAYLFAECGARHVCYLISSSKHSVRVTAFIRALLAGLLKGFAVKKSYAMAEYVALNDLLPIARQPGQICKLLPTSKRHNISIGDQLLESMATDTDIIALIDAALIPVLTSQFFGRDIQVKQVKAALARKDRICNIYGCRGIGKTSIAIHVAKSLYRVKNYRNGVHYFAIGLMVEHIQSCIRPVLTSLHNDKCLQSNMHYDDPLPKIIGELEVLLRSLPETDPANFPTSLLVLDGCDMVLPALEVFVLYIIRSFPSVQILLTSTNRMRLDSTEDEVFLEEAVHVEGLEKLDSTKLFLKLLRQNLTSSQYRQHFPDSSIEAISNDKRILGAEGNPLQISRLVHELLDDNS